MFKLIIGRYRFILGKIIWFQIKMPVTIKHFWILWFIKEARKTDVGLSIAENIGLDEGRIYRYWKGV